MLAACSRIGCKISCDANTLAVSLICAALIGRRVFVCWASIVTIAAVYKRVRTRPSVTEPPPEPSPQISSPARRHSFEPPRGFVEAQLPDVMPLLNALRAALVGDHEAIEGLTLALLAGGHALIEGPPGLAKTLACRTLAATAGGTFSRIQCTADLSPSDVTGSEVYDPRDLSFRARIGPIDANFVLADEINRAPARTQAAFLEAMEERRVTIGSVTHALPAPFMMLATMNENEPDGVYPLPRAQLDRFLLKVVLAFPNAADEIALLDRQDRDRSQIEPVISICVIESWQDSLAGVYCAPALKEYAVALVAATRAAAVSGHLAYGAGPRASLGILRTSRAAAVLSGRPYVLPGDLDRIAPAVLRHRVGFAREYALSHADRERQLHDIVQCVSIP